MRNVVPAPGVEVTVIVPPSFSTFSRTIARPSPRPDKSVMIGLVDSPEWKMSPVTSASAKRAASPAAMSPRRTAAFPTLRASIPAPSSATVSSTRFPSTGFTVIVTDPRLGLPSSRRASGFSMP